MPPVARGKHGRDVSATAAGPERLQKVLAAAGLGSRRQCEELILTGRVEVDRKVVTELGTKVDPVEQQIRVDGVTLPQADRMYFAVHKPPGVVCTNRDPAGRPRVIDLVPFPELRLFPVGRLDLHSEGLILLTNDGELANRLMHPRYGVEKTYRVLVAGRPTPEVLTELRRGVYLAEGVARVSSVAVKKDVKQSTVMEMVLKEGQNREIRRILARVGHKVIRLMRLAVGPVRLGDLPPGGFRRLTREEVEALRRASGGPGRRTTSRGRLPHGSRRHGSRMRGGKSPGSGTRSSKKSPLPPGEG
jgi:23S rRNA pseudouridine2605 synthase